MSEARGFPADPDLKPVAAAQAMLDRLATTPAAPAPPGPVAAPVIAPAEPDRWQRQVPLSFPVLVDGVEVTGLTLRRLTARALMDLMMDDDGAESLNRRARAAIAGVHPDVIDALDADDAVTVMEAIRPFLPRALAGAEVLELAAAAGGVLDAGGA